MAFCHPQLVRRLTTHQPLYLMRTQLMWTSDETYHFMCLVEGPADRSTLPVSRSITLHATRPDGATIIHTGRLMPARRDYTRLIVELVGGPCDGMDLPTVENSEPPMAVNDGQHSILPYVQCDLEDVVIIFPDGQLQVDPKPTLVSPDTVEVFKDLRTQVAEAGNAEADVLRTVHGVCVDQLRTPRLRVAARHPDAKPVPVFVLSAIRRWVNHCDEWQRGKSTYGTLNTVTEGFIEVATELTLAYELALKNSGAAQPTV